MDKKLINAVARQMGGIATLRESASDICTYGASCGFNGFIYHTETEAFTKKNHALIMELLSECADDTGINALELLSGFNCFKNIIYFVCMLFYYCIILFELSTPEGDNT